VTFLPVVFGSIGLIVLGIYQAQRYGVFLHSFYSFDRFIQHHLDCNHGIWFSRDFARCCVQFLDSLASRTEPTCYGWDDYFACGFTLFGFWIFTLFGFWIVTMTTMPNHALEPTGTPPFSSFIVIPYFCPACRWRSHGQGACGSAWFR
jgi:hypothetical protein